ncbi:hypothetical protein IAT38_007493 [Cryptococcus sp. DSM 104549]
MAAQTPIPHIIFGDIMAPSNPHPAPVSRWRLMHQDALLAVRNPGNEGAAQLFVKIFFNGFQDARPDNYERDLRWFFPQQVDLVDLRASGGDGMPDKAFWNCPMQQAVLRRMTPSNKEPSVDYKPSMGVRQAAGAVIAYTLIDVLGYLLSAWETVGTWIGLFVCHHLQFGRVVVADDGHVLFEWEGEGIPDDEEYLKVGDFDDLLARLLAHPNAPVPYSFFDRSTAPRDAVLDSRGAGSLGGPPTGPNWDDLRASLRLDAPNFIRPDVEQAIAHRLRRPSRSASATSSVAGMSDIGSGGGAGGAGVSTGAGDVGRLGGQRSSGEAGVSSGGGGDDGGHGAVQHADAHPGGTDDWSKEVNAKRAVDVGASEIGSADSSTHLVASGGDGNSSGTGPSSSSDGPRTPQSLIHVEDPSISPPTTNSSNSANSDAAPGGPMKHRAGGAYVGNDDTEDEGGEDVEGDDTTSASSEGSRGGSDGVAAANDNGNEAGNVECELWGPEEWSVYQRKQQEEATILAIQDVIREKGILFTICRPRFFEKLLDDLDVEQTPAPGPMWLPVLLNLATAVTDSCVLFGSAST